MNEYLHEVAVVGEVSERFKEAVLKTVEPDEGSVGSNPTPSANVFWWV